MNTRISIFRHLLLTAFLCLSALTQAQQADYVEGQLFVQFNPTYHQEINWTHLSGKDCPEQLQPFVTTFDLRSIHCPFILENEALKRTYVFDFGKDWLADHFIKDLEALPEVTYAERVPAYETFYTPNDPQYPTQWHLQTVQADLAWDVITTQTANVVIAIVDDAVLLSHEDLTANIWTNPGETPGDGIDNDGNGYVDDVNGWDAADNDNDPNPDNPTNNFFSHGTHCAGIASARTDNNIGIASLGYHAQIMPVKTATLPNPAAVVAGYQGVQYAIVNDADVISMSWGGGGSSATYQAIFDQAYQQGIVCVAAAGNNNTSMPMYPASYNYVISVGATDQGDLKAGFSNYGSTIDVMAPGVAIYSCLAGSNSSYGNLQGTSMACPLVSGLAAMLLACDPNLTPDDVENCIESTADDIYPLNPGFSGQLGAGRINAANAVTCVKQIVARFDADFTFACPGQTINFMDISGGTPTSWQWSFPGGTPSSSTVQNPSITYANPGTYDVTLIVSDGNTSDTITQTAFITVGTPHATLSGGGSILPGYTSYLRFDFTGNSPWSVTYFDGTNSTVLNNITNNPYYHPVSPTVTTTYTITAFSDAGCAGTFSDSAVVTVLPPTATPVCYYTKYYGDALDNQIFDAHYNVIEDATYGVGRSTSNAAMFCRFDAGGNLTFAVEFPGMTTGFMRLAPAPNGDYLCIGIVSNDLVVARMTNTGNLVWLKRYDDGFERFPRIVESAGDSYILGCWHGASGDDGAFIRIDGSGNIIWQTSFHNIDDQLYSMYPNGTGGAIFSGGLHGGGSVDMFVGEIDVNGNFTNIMEYNTPNYVMNEAVSVIKTQNNEYITLSRMNAVNSAPWDASIKRLDSNFNLIWETSYANPNGRMINLDNIVEDNHGNIYAMTRYNNGGTDDAVIAKFDASGNFIWSKTITDSRWLGALHTGSVPVDNLILYRAHDGTNFGNRDLFLSRTDTSLNSCNAVPVQTTFPVTTWTNAPLSYTTPALNFSVTNMSNTPVPLNYQTGVICDSCPVDTACIYKLAEQKISDTQGNFSGILTNTDQFGTDVCAIGDLNGDGITDLAVGAAFDDENGNNHGAVWILFMNSNGTVASQQKINDSNGGLTGGLNDTDLFGVRVAPIGDFNGDGYPDIAVGADLQDEGGSDYGAVYLLYLNPNGTVAGQSKISATQGNFTGAFSTYCRFGSSITAMGDLNGDNVTDLAIGMERDDDGGSDNGSVYILFMNANGTVNSHQKISATQGNFNGTLSNDDRFGISLANMGDMNGDGYTDLAVGAFQDDDGGTNRGAVWILFLDNTGMVLSEAKISETQGNFPGNLDNLDQFGVSIAPMGDMNFDGVPDLLVGARRDDDGGTNRGATYLLLLNSTGSVDGFMKLSDTQGNLSGPLDDEDHFGRSVANIGDLNLDGITDMAVGAFLDDDGGTDRGAVYLFMLDDSCSTVTACNLTADFSATTVCVGDTTFFTDLSIDLSDSIMTWIWDFGDGDSIFGIQNPYHIYGAGGTYNVTLIVGNDAAPVCYDTVTLAVNVIDQPSLIMPSDTIICLGDSIQLSPVAIACGSGPWSYSWTPAASLNNPNLQHPLASPGSTTTYTVTATNGLSTITGTVTIDVDLGCCVSHAGIGTDPMYCEGDTVYFTNTSSSGTNQSWEWDFGPDATPTTHSGQTPPPVVFDGPGVYTVTLILTDDCGIDTVTHDALVYPGPIAEAGPDVVICAPGTVMIGDSAVAGYSYDWDPGNLLSDSMLANPIATVNTDTMFIVEVTDNFTGCTAWDTMIVQINPPVPTLISDTTICDDDDLLLDVTTTGATYLWHDASTQPTYLVTGAGLYWVTVTSPCTNFTDSISVAEMNCDSTCSMSLPNIFTPNDDGLNDVFLPIQIGSCEDNYGMFIYNRWGQIVWSVEGLPLAAWDGYTTDGKQAPEGTYYYIVTTATEVFKGHVTLLR